MIYNNNRLFGICDIDNTYREIYMIGQIDEYYSEYQVNIYSDEGLIYSDNVISTSIEELSNSLI